jgi:hypothetical protein
MNRAWFFIVGMSGTWLQTYKAIFKEIFAINNPYNIVERYFAGFSCKPLTAVGSFGLNQYFLFDHIL